MVYLILDTNIWVYLAKGKNTKDGSFFEGENEDLHHYILDKIIEKVNNNEYTIIINKYILNEYNQGKSKNKIQIVTIKNKIKELKKFKLIGSKFNESLNARKKEIEHLEKRKRKNINHLDKLNEFIENNCEIVPVSEELILLAGTKALEKKEAPFLNSKNNMADALLVYSSAEYLQTKLDEFNRALFVSNNYKEFAVSKTEDKFHPDIVKHINNKHFSYHRHLATLLDVSEDLQMEIEFILDEIRQNENYFNCLTLFCGNEDFSSFGFLDDVLRVSSNQNEYLDPNQYLLFDLPKIKESKQYQLKKTLSGNCTFCNTEHILCPGCKRLIAEFNEDNIFYCDYCEHFYSKKWSNRNEDFYIIKLNDDELNNLHL